MDTNTTYAVIYARYSSDRQREESIEGQIRVCTEYAQRNGLTVLHVYADRALTGRTDRRPEFLQMIKDAEKMKFSQVIVYKLNRFSRNRYDSAKYKHKLKKYGVKVVSAMENITDDPSGILLESVIEGMAEFYSAELSENVMHGMTENVLEGKWPGGYVPLGYVLDADHRLQIEPYAAETVRKIYQLAKEGRTPSSICHAMKAEGRQSRSGRPFVYNTLHTILTNEIYTGTLLWHDIRAEHAVPAIIDTSTWKDVQAMLNQRKHAKTAKRSDNYLLAGKLYCGHCGEPMVGKSGTSKHGNLYYYYNCSGRLHKSGCSLAPVRADKLEDLVVQTTTSILSSHDAVQAIARQAIALQDKQEEASSVTALKRQIRDTQKKLNNCIKAVENGLVSDTMTQTIQNHEQTLQAMKDALAKEELLQNGPQLTEKQITFFFMSVAERLKSEPVYKSILLTSIVRAVIVNDDYIEIQYNYKKELPTLDNPVKVSSSHIDKLVTR